MLPRTRQSIIVLALAVMAVGSVQSPRAAQNTSTCNLRIAWINYDDDRQRYDDLANYLGAQLGCAIKGEPFRYDDFSQVADRMRLGTNQARRIDMALFTPYTYVEARKLVPDIDVIASYKDGSGRSTYSAYIVWKKGDLDFDGLLKAMKGDHRKKLVLVNPNSTSGYFWPVDYLLREKQTDLLSGEIGSFYSDKHDKSLDRLLRDENAWAAAVYDGAYEVFAKRHRAQTRAWRVLAIGVPIPEDAFAVSANLDENLKRRLTTILLGIGNDGNRDGRKWLDKYRDWITNWVKASDSDYDPVRAVVRFVYPKVRLELDISGDTGEIQLRRAIDELGAKWFGHRDDPGLEKILRASIQVARSENKLTADIQVNGHRESIAASTPSDLAAGVVDRLKSNAPREGYVSEVQRRPGEWVERGLEVKMGAEDGIKKGYTATITRIEPDISGARTTDIPAWVASVERDNSLIKPAALLTDPKSQAAMRLVDDIKLDSSDRVTYRVAVKPPERTTAGAVAVAAVERELAATGNLQLRLKFTLAGTGGEMVHIGRDGYFAEVHVDPPAHFTDKGQAATLLLEPAAREFFVKVEAPRTELGVSGAVTVGDVSLPWNVWPQLMLFAFALVGGAVGGMVRAICAEQPWYTVLAEAAVGCVAGVILILVVLALPGTWQMSSSANLASGMTCLAIGLAGGFGGVVGLRSLLDPLTKLLLKLDAP